MQAFAKFNRGVKYLLAVIDVFSKYGWLIPLKDKMGKSVALALKERKPEKMWVDKGKEFYNKDVKDLIELYSTENEEKIQRGRKMDKDDERKDVEIFFG